MVRAVADLSAPAVEGTKIVMAEMTNQIVMHL